MRPYFPQLYIAPQRCETYSQCRITLSEHSDTIISSKYTADVASVGLTQWVAELEARNLAFEALVKERFDETAARTTDIVMKQARAQLDEVYKTIVERVNALAVVEGVETYEAFIKTLNAVIAKYAVKHHHHRHNHADNSQNSQNNNTLNGGSI